eukprot:TRINITY_DN12827_c2_g1_i1.p1 TRINITY_DN12827_c2_g1~~TRINITY_DN12827_c2_g1_i1.p1  ORF type:complete len:122 (+),score=44.68 TRINITY_DN12827_c2_g1_i1:99-464(+)
MMAVRSAALVILFRVTAAAAAAAAAGATHASAAAAVNEEKLAAAKALLGKLRDRPADRLAAAVVLPAKASLQSQPLKQGSSSLLQEGQAPEDLCECGCGCACWCQKLRMGAEECANCPYWS